MNTDEESSPTDSSANVPAQGTVTDGRAFTPKSSIPCEMCQNYELNLTLLQENERALKEEIKSLKSISSRHNTELVKEREDRANLEKKMNEVMAEMDEKIVEAFAKNTDLESKMHALSHLHDKLTSETTQSVNDAKAVSTSYEENYVTLSEKYKRLLGVHRTTASEMRAEQIDIPTEIDQLQFFCLQLREELIELKAAKQHETSELQNEIAVLRDQIIKEQELREYVERDAMSQINELQTQLGIANSKLSSASDAVMLGDERLRQIRDLQKTVAELEAQVTQVQNERKAVEITAQNYKNRCASLQTELDTSEAVQKDFVKLSQSLQIQLEKIRQSEQEVRWQWEEDVEACSGCNTSVIKLKPKPRCHHCGRIFCAPCVKHEVPSGPSRRPAPVCEVCHTLLNRDSKPFFAHDPQ